MHKEMGGEEIEGSCVIIPSCVAVAAEEELAPLLLCWLLGEDAGRMEHLGMGGGDPNLVEKWCQPTLGQLIWFKPHL